MSVDCYYANHDKLQYFRSGLFGTNNSLSRLGFANGARALSLLLTSGGSWREDRVSVVIGDSEEFDRLAAKAIRIDVEVELMLIDVDGFDWLEERVEHSNVAFRKLCTYAWILDRADISAMLDRKFGIGDWQRKYEEHVRGNTDTWVSDVIAAKNRQLKIRGSTVIA